MGGGAAPSGPNPPQNPPYCIPLLSMWRLCGCPPSLRCPWGGLYPSQHHFGVVSAPFLGRGSFPPPLAPFWGLHLVFGGAGGGWTSPPALHPGVGVAGEFQTPLPDFGAWRGRGLDAPTWFPVAAGRGWKKGEMELNPTLDFGENWERSGGGGGRNWIPSCSQWRGWIPPCSLWEGVMEGLDPTWLPLEGLDPVLLPMVGGGSLFPGFWKGWIPPCSLWRGWIPPCSP